MILHVAKGAMFLPSFIRLVNGHFDPTGHLFWLDQVPTPADVPAAPNVHVAGRGLSGRLSSYRLLITKLHQADKIVLHGLLNWRVVVVLMALPWVLKKCYWVIWGADLYDYKKSEKTLKEKVFGWLRKSVGRRVGHLVTYIDGDIELAREWYGARGEHWPCLMYQSNVYRSGPVNPPERNPLTVNILVGNSANQTNEHFEVFDKLASLGSDRMHIFVPLSYGDRTYAQEVAEYGKRLFGDRFNALFDFMAPEDYQRFLASMDIAIFNHRRQQAMGNTIALLGAGKTVYLRDGVSHTRMLKELGLTILNLSAFSESPLPARQAEANVGLIKQHFSNKVLLSQWAAIFSDGHGSANGAHSMTSKDAEQ